MTSNLRQEARELLDAELNGSFFPAGTTPYIAETAALRAIEKLLALSTPKTSEEDVELTEVRVDDGEWVDALLDQLDNPSERHFRFTYSNLGHVCRMAAAVIRHQRAALSEHKTSEEDVERLRAALKPFASAAECYVSHDGQHDFRDEDVVADGPLPKITVGHLRAAADAMAAMPQNRPDAVEVRNQFATDEARPDALGEVVEALEWIELTGMAMAGRYHGDLRCLAIATRAHNARAKVRSPQVPSDSDALGKVLASLDAAEKEALAEALHRRLAHGTQEHRDWLRDDLRALVFGEPPIPPRGSGNKDALISCLYDALGEVVEALENAGKQLRADEQLHQHKISHVMAGLGSVSSREEEAKPLRAKVQHYRALAEACEAARAKVRSLPPQPQKGEGGQ